MSVSRFSTGDAPSLHAELLRAMTKRHKRYKKKEKEEKEEEQEEECERR